MDGEGVIQDVNVPAKKGHVLFFFLRRHVTIYTLTP